MCQAESPYCLGDVLTNHMQVAQQVCWLGFLTIAPRFLSRGRELSFLPGRRVGRLVGRLTLRCLCLGNRVRLLGNRTLGWRSLPNWKVGRLDGCEVVKLLGCTVKILYIQFFLVKCPLLSTRLLIIAFYQR